MKKMRAAYIKLVGAIIAVLAIIMCSLIFIQVICRYVLFHSLPWSEELCRYLFISIVFLGAFLGIQDKTEINIDLLDHLLTGTPKKVLRIFRYLVTVIGTATLVVSGLMLTQLGTIASSPTLPIKMSVIYLFIPIGMLLALIEAVISLVAQSKGKGEDA